MKENESPAQTFLREKGEEGIGFLSGEVKPFLVQDFSERIEGRQRDGVLNYMVLRFDGNTKNFRDKEGAGFVVLWEEEVRGPLGEHIFQPNLEALLKFYKDSRDGTLKV